MHHPRPRLAVRSLMACDDEITMIDSAGSVKAQPGALNGGNGFTVTWVRSS